MENFSFIPNHIKIEGPLPFELMEGCEIKKASDDQIEVIETNLQQMGTIFTPSLLISSFSGLPYKVKYSLNKISKYERYISSSSLERNEWKYYILSYSDNLSPFKLQFASNLTDFELIFDAFNCNVYEGQYGFNVNPEIAFRFFQETDLLKEHILMEEDLLLIKELHQSITDIEGQYTEIINSIKLFNNIRYIHTDYRFKTLGLFSVIESLLTHKPSTTETGDSVTRQINTKVPLLLRRSTRKIDCNKYFGISEEPTIWKKLYSYRSALAHGRNTDFKRDLHSLKSPQVVHDFLIGCIKLLLLQALTEPQLVSDLKEC